jgi:heme A synthase
MSEGRLTRWRQHWNRHAPMSLAAYAIMFLLVFALGAANQFLGLPYWVAFGGVAIYAITASRAHQHYDEEFSDD